ncbi:SdpI family protein [Leucobacter sp. OH2974_COT-288]|nr:SdpI family protein [Leucobacter sp. OH2974_COT-288]
MTEAVVVLIGAAVLLAGSLLIVWLGRLSERGTLARNYLAGLRTRQTLASDEAWIAGHRAGAKSMIVGGAGGAVGAVAGIVFGVLFMLGTVTQAATENLIACAVVVSCGWMIIWVLVATAKANRAAREVNERARSAASTNSRA